MTQAGADFSKLNIVISDGTGFEALGKSCDIMWFFEGWDNIIAAMNGCELNYMELRQLDERLDYYTPVIIASDAVIEGRSGDGFRIPSRHSKRISGRN